MPHLSGKGVLMRYSVTTSFGRQSATFSLAALFIAAAGCTAGTTSDIGFGGSGGTNSSVDKGSSSTGFGDATGTQSTGAGSSCNSADCIGSTPQGGCDANLAIASSDAMDGARAIGLCQKFAPGGWGVTQASWVKADLAPLDTTNALLGKGILKHFGDNISPREGNSLLALSSGTARNPTDPGYQDVGGFDKGYQTTPPPGFSPTSPAGCPATGAPHDSASLLLKIHTPTDAKSIKFDLNFYTYEFPNYICSMYNDFFVALLNPPPADAEQGNISFDSMGNLISVNAGFLTVCEPQDASNNMFFPCAAGPSGLAGTGFDYTDPFGDPENSASTGWLTTTAPVAPGTDITLQFAIWDSGDGILDSTVLIDNFTFELSDTVTGTTPVPM
jgi:hypothetical protein